MTEPQPSSLPNSFTPLAGWMAASIILLALAAFGPKLWASQHTDDAAIAIEIVAAGQLLLAVIAWPIWTRSATAAVTVVITSPGWLLLAGQLAERSDGEVFAFAWKLMAALGLLAFIRLATPRRAIGFAWAFLMAIAVGVPALLYLKRDY